MPATWPTSLKTYRLRMLLLLVCSMLVFGVILARLYEIQVRQHEDYSDRADRQQHKRVRLTPRRGEILDRNQLALATSYQSDTIVLDTRTLPAPDLAEDWRARLAEALEVSEDYLSRLQDRPRRYVVRSDADDACIAAVREVEQACHLPEDSVVYAGHTIRLDTRKLRKPPREGWALELADAVGRPPAHIEACIRDRRRHILYRKAPEEISARVDMVENEFQLPPGAIVYEKHSKRYYPNDTLASHILGFTSIDEHGDNIGMSGLELVYNDELQGRYMEQRVPVNSFRRGLEPLAEETVAATYGKELVLTLDGQIQMFAERSLRRQVEAMRAKSGVAVVMDVQTGAILALANAPDYDPNAFTLASSAQRRNRVLTDPFEIGSVMKIITTAILLDHGLLHHDELIDCKNGYARIEGRNVRDEHPLGIVPFHHAFAESSNIAMSLLATRLEPPLYYESLVRFGLGGRTGIDLPGEGAGILRPVREWSGLSRTSIAIGYEVALTPIQVVTALAAIGNDGARMKPHIVREVRTPRGRVVRRVEPQVLDYVASPRTCATVLGLLELVVTEGTGTAARIPGYRIGGKTGTTRKHHHGPEGERLYIASFAGLAPIDHPRIAVVVSIDEPQESRWGGTVAAPVFRDIVLGAAHMLGLPPDDPDAFAEYLHARAEERLDETDGTDQADPDSGGDAGEAPPEGDEPPAPPETETALAGPPMPDCLGLTIVEAWDRLEAAGIEARMLGSGIVVGQDPEPGRPLPSGHAARLYFALPSQAGETVEAD